MEGRHLYMTVVSGCRDKKKRKKKEKKCDECGNLAADHLPNNLIIQLYGGRERGGEKVRHFSVNCLWYKIIN